MITDDVDNDTLLDRLRRMTELSDTVEPIDLPKQYRFIQPPADQLESFVTFVTDSRQHYMLGFDEIDMRTRGYRPGELILVAGYSHGGKSQMLLTSILHNTDKPILWVTLDEPAELVMSKLVSMVLRTSADQLEADIKAGDAKTIDHIRATVRERFSKLLIIDRQITLGAMGSAVKEAEDYFGAPLSAMMIDYLGLIPSDQEREDGKAKEVKSFATAQDFPTFVIHQNSRSGGGPGEPITLTSLAFGGDREATMIIGVRRKKYDRSLRDAFERSVHEHTVSISIVKNKRPPAKLGEWDYLMDPDTGLIVPRSQPTPAVTSWLSGLQHGSHAPVRPVIDPEFGTQQDFTDYLGD